jgi:hypothetical protein
MATSFSQSETRENGIIILGNAGAGKSHICNILVGYNRFEAEFQPEAVTTVTEHDRVTLGSNSFRIYNIPGLVEVNQEHIDRNKREIMKAFDQSPTSIVLFVWTQIGGRAQNDDVIAFNALNDAYKFPTGSLTFIVNNIPTKRPPDYEGKFITTLSTMLKPMPVSLKDTFFLDTMDSEDKKKISEARSRLILFINHHHASLQRRHADIMLQSDQLNKMRELLKKQQLEAERDREAFQNQIRQMTKEYQIAKEEEKKRYQLMQDKLETVRIQAEKDRAVSLLLQIGLLSSSCCVILDSSEEGTRLGKTTTRTKRTTSTTVSSKFIAVSRIVSSSCCVILGSSGGATILGKTTTRTKRTTSTTVSSKFIDLSTIVLLSYCVILGSSGGATILGKTTTRTKRTTSTTVSSKFIDVSRIVSLRCCAILD